MMGLSMNVCLDFLGMYEINFYCVLLLNTPEDSESIAAASNAVAVIFSQICSCFLNFIFWFALLGMPICSDSTQKRVVNVILCGATNTTFQEKNITNLQGTCSQPPAPSHVSWAQLFISVLVVLHCIASRRRQCHVTVKCMHIEYDDTSLVESHGDTLILSLRMIFHVYYCCQQVNIHVTQFINNRLNNLHQQNHAYHDTTSSLG